MYPLFSSWKHCHWIAINHVDLTTALTSYMTWTNFLSVFDFLQLFVCEFVAQETDRQTDRWAQFVTRPHGRGCII